MTNIVKQCSCDLRPQDIVMTRKYLDDLLQYERAKEHNKTLDDFIDVLNIRRDIYFSQTLVSPDPRVWQNKIQVIDLLLVHVEEMKCQTTLK